jgi:hypothetical protein
MGKSVMRKEVSQKLTRAIWRQRFRTWGSAALVALAVLAGAAYLMELRIGRLDPATEAKTVQATILEAHRLPARANISVARIRTDAGEEADADSQLGVILQPRERVAVSRVRHASGKVSYHIVEVLALPQ